MPLFTAEPFIAAFIIGLMGAGHCLGMCGGIMAALSFALGDVSAAKKWRLLLAYNIGRLLSYTCIGLIVGIFGAQITALGGLFILRLLAGTLLVLMGLYVAGWWRVLVRLEHMGQGLCRYIKPIGDKVMPVKSMAQALVLGSVWGWLPCGLVYSVVVYAVAQANPVGGGLVMLAFGLGTLPAVLLGGASASALKHYLSKRLVQHLMGVLLCAFGAWTIIMAVQHQNHSGHAHSDHMQSEQSIPDESSPSDESHQEHHHH